MLGKRESLILTCYQMIENKSTVNLSISTARVL